MHGTKEKNRQISKIQTTYSVNVIATFELMNVEIGVIALNKRRLHLRSQIIE